jgi:hypothetical protein
MLTYAFHSHEEIANLNKRECDQPLQSDYADYYIFINRVYFLTSKYLKILVMY